VVLEKLARLVETGQNTAIRVSMGEETEERK
jgi:hypothetical protein